jgi:hypothetical protein
LDFKRYRAPQDTMGMTLRRHSCLKCAKVFLSFQIPYSEEKAHQILNLILAATKKKPIVSSKRRLVN